MPRSLRWIMPTRKSTAVRRSSGHSGTPRPDLPTGRYEGGVAAGFRLDAEPDQGFRNFAIQAQVGVGLVRLVPTPEGLEEVLALRVGHVVIE